MELKELQEAYEKLGKEIEALKNKPVYCLSIRNKQVVKFTGLREGIVVKQGTHKTSDDVGFETDKWCPYTHKDVWQQLEVSNGFFDGQLVWCWNSDDTHKRELKFYDTKNKVTFYFSGVRDGNGYDNYEAYEGNYPQWALKAFETLER